MRSWQVKVALLCMLAGCPTTVARVTVPTDPSKDAAPAITITAIPLVPNGPGAAGDVEPGKSDVSTTTSVNVTRGAPIMLLGNARNPGGVQSFSVTVSQGGATILSGTATGAEDAAGTALNTLTIRAPDTNPTGTLTVNVTDPVTVTATATNFNTQPTTITVTYVPADLAVAIAANPTTIGYKLAAQSNVTWSVLYGAPPIKIDLAGAGLPSNPQPSGSATVAPAQNTTYSITATDQKTTRSKSVLVAVNQPPPPPSPKLIAGPNEGYNCLGVADTLTWSVGNCGAGCDVTLTGHGHGYAAKYSLTLKHVTSPGSYTVTPGDQIDFSLTATSPFGSNHSDLSLTIAAPNVCPGGGSPPSISLYYFAVKASNPSVTECQWFAVPADNEGDAENELKSTYGSSYTVTSISIDDYANSRRCP